MSNADPLKWRAIQSKYAAFTAVEERADYEAGLSDGKRCAEQDWEEALAAGERRIVAEIDADGLAYRDSCLTELGTEARAASRASARQVDLVDRKHRLNADYNSSLQLLDIDSGPSSAKFDELRIACDRASEAHDELRVELRRQPRREISTWPYRIVIFGVFLLEIPLNAAALELLNDLQRYYNIAYAIGIGLGVVWFSHVLGMNNRQIFGSRSLGEVAKRVASIVFALLFLAGMLAVLAQWREQLVHVQGRTVGQIGAAVPQIVQRALQEAATNWFRGLSGEAVQLTLLNVLLIAVASVASFFRVDPDARYDDASRRLEKAQAKYDRHRRRHEKALKKLTHAHHEKATTIETLLGEAARDVRMAGEHIDQFKQAANAGVVLIRAVREKRIAAYRQGFIHGIGRRMAPESIAPPSAPGDPGDGGPETGDDDGENRR